MWIDVVRGETVLLIIVFHSTGLLRYGSAPAPRHAATFNNLSEPYWMPTLSVLSGMLVDSSMNKGAREYYEGKTRTVLYPFALWSAVHGVVFRMPANLDSALQLGTGGTYLFFLAFLFGFDAVSYPLRAVHPGITAGAALLIGALAPARFPSVPDRFTERFWYLLAMFMLGRCASNSPDTWRRLQRSRATLLVASAATLAGSLAATTGARVSYRWQWVWSPALAMILFARLARAIEDSGASRPLSFIGRNSIIYYTMHFPVAYGVIRRSESRGVRSGWRALATALVASVGVPTAAAWARRRSDLVEHLFSA
jgi:fucose 4-O-acetylase-like acetyltransferase